MKPKWIGLGILIIVMAAVIGFLYCSKPVDKINGYLGGEKIGLFEDEKF